MIDITGFVIFCLVVFCLFQFGCISCIDNTLKRIEKILSIKFDIVVKNDTEDEEDEEEERKND